MKGTIKRPLFVNNSLHFVDINLVHFLIEKVSLNFLINSKSIDFYIKIMNNETNHNKAFV